MTEYSHPTIVVADDERGIADLYATWLEPDYTVKTAYNGEDALEAIGETTDVAILDRQMPKLSGDDVIEGIQDHGYSCRVALITAVEPDVDILDLKCDDYLIKPVSQQDFRGLVEDLLQRATYDSRLQSYFELVSKKAVLDAQAPADGITDTSEYCELTEEIESMRVELDETFAEFDDEKYDDLFRDLEPTPSRT